MSGEFQYCLHLISCEPVENFNYLINGKAILQIFEDRRHRDPRSAKYPRSANFSWHALHCVAL